MNLNGNYVRSYPKEWIEEELILRAFISETKIINPGEIVDINTGFIVNDDNLDNLNIDFKIFNKKLSKNYLKIVSDDSFIKNNKEIILYVKNDNSPYCVSRKDNEDGSSEYAVFPEIFKKIIINPGDILAKVLITNKEKTFWSKKSS